MVSATTPASAATAGGYDHRRVEPGEQLLALRSPSTAPSSAVAISPPMRATALLKPGRHRDMLLLDRAEHR